MQNKQVRYDVRGDLYDFLGKKETNEISAFRICFETFMEVNDLRDNFAANNAEGI